MWSPRPRPSCPAASRTCPIRRKRSSRSPRTTGAEAPTLKYESREIVAEKDFEIVHGFFSGLGQPTNRISADIVRGKDGVLVEHWDVIEEEATQEQSKSGQPMFGDKFTTQASGR